MHCSTFDIKSLANVVLAAYYDWLRWHLTRSTNAASRVAGVTNGTPIKFTAADVARCNEQSNGRTNSIAMMPFAVDVLVALRGLFTELPESAKMRYTFYVAVFTDAARVVEAKHSPTPVTPECATAFLLQAIGNELITGGLVVHKFTKSGIMEYSNSGTTKFARFSHLKASTSQQHEERVNPAPREGGVGRVVQPQARPGLAPHLAQALQLSVGCACLCTAYVLLVHCLCVASVLPMHCLCVASAVLAHCLCVASALPVHC